MRKHPWGNFLGFAALLVSLAGCQIITQNYHEKLASLTLSFHIQGQNQPSGQARLLLPEVVSLNVTLFSPEDGVSFEDSAVFNGLDSSVELQFDEIPYGQYQVTASALDSSGTVRFQAATEARIDDESTSLLLNLLPVSGSSAPPELFLDTKTDQTTLVSKQSTSWTLPLSSLSSAAFTVSLESAAPVAIYIQDSLGNLLVPQSWGTDSRTVVVPLTSALDGYLTLYNTDQFDHPVSLLLSAGALTPPPVFSLADGSTFATDQNLVLTDEMAGVVIRYTTDGSIPTESSPVYTAPIALSGNGLKTFTARATGAGFGSSLPVTRSYRITYPVLTAPGFSQPQGTLATGTVVNFQNSTAGVIFHYTTDGSTPTALSPTATGVTVNSNTNVKAIATAVGYTDSPVASASYLVDAAAPSLSPAGGTFNSDQLVAITDATA